LQLETNSKFGKDSISLNKGQLVEYLPSRNQEHVKHFTSLHHGGIRALLSSDHLRSHFKKSIQPVLDKRRRQHRLHDAEELRPVHCSEDVQQTLVVEEGAQGQNEGRQEQQEALQTDDPFADNGRLAWLVKDPPDAATIVENMLLWEKYNLVADSTETAQEQNERNATEVENTQTDVDHFFTPTNG
jgi:hypothetical protein